MKDARDAPALDWRALMLGQDSGDRPLARDGLQALMRAFPDAAQMDDDPDRDTTPRKEPETWPTAT